LAGFDPKTHDQWSNALPTKPPLIAISHKFTKLKKQTAMTQTVICSFVIVSNCAYCIYDNFASGYNSMVTLLTHDPKFAGLNTAPLAL
jgi:hypothetical protein